MKTAVLFAARQSFGFELCYLLLEKGYEVFAIDHQDWITSQQEENWLLIGRNANVRYEELNNEKEVIYQTLVEEECLYIIPTIDYFNRHNTNVREQLLAQLQGFLEQKKNKECLLLIHPHSTERKQSSFAEKLETFIRLLKQMHNVQEFCLSDFIQEEKKIGLEQERRDNTGEDVVACDNSYVSNSAKKVLRHIEQQKMLENNS